MPKDRAAQEKSRQVFDLVKAAENELGWQPRIGHSIYRERAAACVRLERAMEAHSLTAEDVRFALAYCKRQRIVISHPSELVVYVDAAMARALDEEYADELGEAIQAAIDWETSRISDGRTYWISRLVRSVGPARTETLNEWKEAGRG